MAAALWKCSICMQELGNDINEANTNNNYVCRSLSESSANIICLLLGYEFQTGTARSKMEGVILCSECRKCIDQIETGLAEVHSAEHANHRPNFGLPNLIKEAMPALALNIQNKMADWSLLQRPCGSSHHGSVVDIAKIISSTTLSTSTGMSETLNSDIVNESSHARAIESKNPGISTCGELQTPTSANVHPWIGIMTNDILPAYGQDHSLYGLTAAAVRHNSLVRQRSNVLGVTIDSGSSTKNADEASNLQKSIRTVTTNALVETDCCIFCNQPANHKGTRIPRRCHPAFRNRTSRVLDYDEIPTITLDDSDSNESGDDTASASQAQ